MSRRVAERMTLDAWGDWEADPTRIHVPVSVDHSRVNQLEAADVLLLATPVVVMAVGWTVSLATFLLSSGA